MATFAGQATVRTSTTLQVNALNVRTQAFTASDPGVESTPVASANQPFELTAGATVTLYTDINWGGFTPSAMSVTVGIYDDAGTQVLAPVTVYNAVPPTGSVIAASNVAFTPALAGTYEIRTVVDYYGADATDGNFIANSDGAFTTSGTPNTWSLAEASRGYLRAGLAVSAVGLSNVSAGGATPSPWAYPDRLYTQATTSVALAAGDTTATCAVDLENAAGAVSYSDTFTPGATTTWSDTGGVGPMTQATPSTFYVRLGKPSNSALSARPAWHFTAAPSGWTLGPVDSGSTSTGAVSILSPAETFSPTLMVTHLLQLEDSTFGSPPMSKSVAAPLGMLPTDDGFIGASIANARGEGQNGLAVSGQLQDAKGFTTAVTWGPHTTATEGGQAGWDPTLQPWTAAKPGGPWTHTVTCSTAGATTLTGGIATLVMLASNPYYEPFTGAGIASPLEAGDHWRPGMPLLAGCSLFDNKHNLLVTPDANPIMIISQFNLSTGRIVYLGADYAWHDLETAGPAYNWPTEQASVAISGGGLLAYVVEFPGSLTTSWFPYDLFFNSRFYVKGTPYNGRARLDPAGVRNSHIGPAYELKLGPLAGRT